MNSKVEIKNFRSFDNYGVTVDLRPLTILTGCNSSGKSSIVKALLLINDILQNKKLLNKQVFFNFNDYPLSLLGNYEGVLNKESFELGNHEIKFKYTVDSPYFGAGIIVQLTFTITDNDTLKEGSLKNIQIWDRKGIILYQGNREDIAKNPTIGSGFYNFFKYPSNGSSNIDKLKKSFIIYHMCKSVVEQLINTPYPCNKTEIAENIQLIKQVFDSFQKILDSQSVACTFDHHLKFFLKESPNYRIVQIPEKIIETEIITYIPVLSELDSWEKKSFEEEFLKRFGNKKYNSFICKSFKDSQYIIFSDYYRSIEEQFLNEQDLSKIHLSSSTFSFDYENCIHSNEDPNEVSLNLLVSVLSSVDCDAEFIKKNEIDGCQYTSHSILKSFFDYCHDGFVHILQQNICDDMRYVGSTRLNVQRIYTNQEKSDDIIIRYADAKRRSSNTSFTPGSFIDKWIQQFGIGYHFSMESLDMGLGFVLKIYKDKSDEKGRILADMGYGITQLISILLEIEIAIILNSNKHTSSRIFPNKLIPFVEAFNAKRKLTGDYEIIDFSKIAIEDIEDIKTKDEGERNRQIVEGSYSPITICIEEPEIHLHPRYQSLLAEMFTDAYKEYNIQFIIETHSEYLVRKIQNIVAKEHLMPEEISLLYVEDSDNEERKVRRIEIDLDGRLKEPFGPGFFDEANTLAMNLLLIKGGLA